MGLRSLIGLAALRVRGPLFLGQSLPGPRAGAVALDVAHQPQAPHQCVPTAAAIALEYYGRRVDPARLWALGRPPDCPYTGMSFVDLVRATDALGFTWFTMSYPATPDGFAAGVRDLIRSVRRRRPVIVSIDMGPNGHAVLVHAYDARVSTVSWVDPSACAGEVAVGWSEFAHRWRTVDGCFRCAVFTNPGACRRRRRLNARGLSFRRAHGTAIVGRPVECRPEVLALRRAVSFELAEHGFEWPADYGAVNLRADGGQVEVSGIRTVALADGIARVLHRLLPHWSYPVVSEAAEIAGEPGWRVVLARHSDGTVCLM
jgi:Peptidase_C39 like family